MLLNATDDDDAGFNERETDEMAAVPGTVCLFHAELARVWQCTES